MIRAWFRPKSQLRYSASSLSDVMRTAEMLMTGAVLAAVLHGRQRALTPSELAVCDRLLDESMQRIRRKLAEYPKGTTDGS